MVCKKCGSKISVTDIVCPGCSTSVEKLTLDGMISVDDMAQDSSGINETKPVEGINTNGITNVYTKTSNEIPNIENNVQNDHVVQSNYNQGTPSILEVGNQSNNIEQNNIDVSQNTLKNNNNLANFVETISASPIAVTTQSEIDNDFSDLKSKKKKHVGLIVFIIVLILAIALAIGYYFLIFSAPKNIFKVGAEKFYSSLSETLKDDYSSLKENVSFNMNISGIENADDQTREIIDLINRLSISMEVNADYINNNLYVDLETQYNENDLIGASVFLQDKIIYADLKDLYANYIGYMPDQEATIESDTSKVTALNNVIKTVKNSLINNLDEKTLSKSKEKITVDGKEIEATKNTLKLNNDATITLINKIFTDLNNDEQFIKDLSILTGQSESDIKDILSKEQIIEEDYEIEFSIYTQGLLNDFTGVEIVIKDATTDLSMSIIKDNESLYTINANDQLNNETIDAAISFSNENDINALTIVIQDSSNLTLAMNFEYSIEYNAEIVKKDVSNSVDYTELTEEDLNNIILKLMENETLVNFITEINNIIPSDNNETIDDNADIDYDLDTNYDYTY